MKQKYNELREKEQQIFRMFYLLRQIAMAKNRLGINNLIDNSFLVQSGQSSYFFLLKWIICAFGLETHKE
jgi:hypothetical protein